MCYNRSLLLSDSELGIKNNNELWIKFCIKCNIKQKYNSYKQFWRAKNNSSLCKSCRPKTDENRKQARNTRIGILVNQKWITDKNTGKWMSMAEMEIFDILSSIYNEVSSQFMIGKYSYDFYLSKQKLLIEYNGTYWHCDPRKYSENYRRRTKTAKEIWNRDKEKQQYALYHGYKFCTVWEADWKSTKNKIHLLEDAINEFTVNN